MSAEPRACPKCGGELIARLIYGLVELNSSIEELRATPVDDSDDVVYAGCCRPVPTLNRHCRTCGYRWLASRSMGSTQD